MIFLKLPDLGIDGACLVNVVVHAEFEGAF
jgi:hypothetical protein